MASVVNENDIGAIKRIGTFTVVTPNLDRETKRINSRGIDKLSPLSMALALSKSHFIT
jgi:hypothetical protein